MQQLLPIIAALTKQKLKLLKHIKTYRHITVYLVPTIVSTVILRPNSINLQVTGNYLWFNMQLLFQK